MSRSWRSDDTSGWLEGFGAGGSGTSYAVPSNEGCSGTISTTTLTLAAAGTFANGDLVLIHQTRGTGAGNWELNKITSGGGTTTLTMAYTLENAYTDSGADQAQVIEMNQYDGMTAGAITSPAWDGSKGGILAWFDKATSTVSGTLTLTGEIGASEGSSSAAGGTVYSFNGGAGSVGNGTAQSGEGTAGAVATDQNPSGNAGGGGYSTGANDRNGGGGGGGNANAGGDGGHSGTASDRGIGGDTSGTASLVTMTPGGAGGGGRNWQTESGAVGGGGAGAAIIFIFAKNIVVSGSIVLTGGAGGTGWSCGGGGAGGSCLLKCETATLGTTLITAAGGVGGTKSGGRSGGNGGVGRIHMDYSVSYTGTTSPTIDVTLDSTITTITGSLVNQPSNLFLMF